MRVLWSVLLAGVACGEERPAGTLDAAPPEVAGLRFADVSAASPDLAANPYGGHSGWDHSDKYAPGVALADFDGDGALDLAQPRNDREDEALRGLHFYRGAGDGTFAEVAPAPIGWDAEKLPTCAVAFDYDGDDDLDLFVGVDGAPSVLLENLGDWQFRDATAEAGLAARSDRVFTAAAGDVDGDGDPDLLTGAWNASAPEHGPGTAPNRLYENLGDGTFAEREGAARCGGRSTLGLALVDLDGDADLDVYVANDYFDDCLLENHGDGTFTDVAPEAGTADAAAHAMGVAVGDLDADARLDLLVTDTLQADTSLGNAVFLGRGGLRFESRGADLGLDGFSALQPDWLVCWGAGIEDFDLDGDPDVHIATHQERRELFFQNRGGEFTPARALIDDLPAADSRGSVYGDLDADGDLDAVIARRGAPLQVLRNEGEAAGHWLAVQVRPLARAPGARVEVEAGGARRVGVIQAGESYMSSGPPEVHFGLGATGRVDRVTATLPGGRILRAEDLAADRRVVLRAD